MPRRKLGPGEGKTYITFGLDPEELRAMETVMKFYRCSQSAALRLLIRNGAEHTPMAPPLHPQPKETDHG